MTRTIAPPGTWSREKLPDGLHVDVADGVATIRLDRPDRLNALTFDIYEALRDVFAAFEDTPEVRAVVLTGTGKGFCSGGDVEDIIGALFDMDEEGLLAFTTLTCDVVRHMRACPQPIVAALNGTVAGAGAALALASDVRLAVPTAKVAFLFVKVGLSGADMGACYLLPRIVGRGRATELLLTGDVVAADQAHRIGLYNRIVEPEALLGEATGLARRLAAGPAHSLAVTKHTLDRQEDASLDEVLAWDAKVQAELMTEHDFREAYEAFTEKRPPRFA